MVLKIVLKKRFTRVSFTIDFFFFFMAGHLKFFSKNRAFIKKNASKWYSRDVFCLVQKSYIMTLNIIYSFPYLSYVAQILPFGIAFGYLFNRFHTSSLSPALWLTRGSDESQKRGWFLWCGISMYVWACAHVYVPINCSNNPGKQKKLLNGSFVDRTCHGTELALCIVS